MIFNQTNHNAGDVNNTGPLPEDVKQALRRQGPPPHWADELGSLVVSVLVFVLDWLCERSGLL